MFFSLLFFCFIHVVISLSSQEDLSITNYSQLGCLLLKPDKQFLVNHIQENSLLPYQTFSSTHMTIELCFRLCRRWIILIFNNQTNCICLYTINKPYELNNHLGEFLSNDNCTSNDIKIYSLTKDIYVLPPLSSLPSHDWSFDGCYYLNGIQAIRASLWLNNVDYIQAIDLCRKHCQKIRGTNHYSYFLSRRKSCYCSLIEFSKITKTIALRKPLRYCSFLPYICSAYSTSSNSCTKYYSESAMDTLIKIDVQRYCLSTDLISWMFDRMFYMCFKPLSFNTQMTSSAMIDYHGCLPLLIKTSEQWNYFIQSSLITRSKLFVPVDRNSTYIFDDLFKSENLSLSSNDLCIVLTRNDLNRSMLFELIPCDTIHSPGHILCIQKPLETMISNEEEFQYRNDEPKLPVDEILTCPSEFILFNKMCYFVYTSFAYTIQRGERLCSNQYSNSTLVKFDLHEWGNIHSTKYLGRTFDDILLEFFYYQLEKKLLNESLDDSSNKHWLRLLLGDRSNSDECVLRYFIRSSGAFTVFHRCYSGGHPVCQCEPILKKIIKIIATNETISLPKNNSQIELKTEPATTTEITMINSTDLLIVPNDTVVPMYDNRTTNLVADEDLLNNETKIEDESYNSTTIVITSEPSTHKHLKYRPLIVILTGPVLALIILFIAIGLLIRHLRQVRGSYSTRSSITGLPHRTRRSSTTVTTGDIPNTPAVLYTHLKSPRLTETDMLLPLDNSIENDDNIELLPTTARQIINKNEKDNDQEEPLYATLK